MPIYEYKCTKCGREFEVFQNITDGDVSSCKYCDGSVKKLVSLSSFQLKGSGWYVTDYGGKKPSGTAEAKEASAEAGGDSGSAPSEATGSETKGTAAKGSED